MIDQKQLTLADYRRKLAHWKAADQPIIDLREMTFDDVLLFHLKIHRARKRESIKLTKHIVTLMAERAIMTMPELLEETKATPPPLYHRMNGMREAGLVRRDDRVYYIATPRLYQYHTKFFHLLK